MSSGDESLLWDTGMSASLLLLLLTSCMALGKLLHHLFFHPPLLVQGMATGHFVIRWEPAVSVSWPKMAWPRWCGAKSEVTYLGPQKHSPAPTLGFVRQSETTLSNASAARGAGRAQVQVDTSIDWKHLLTCVFCSVSVEQAAQREL